eukprot:5678563-Ditylum_brightwellii.AAC.1
MAHRPWQTPTSIGEVGSVQCTTLSAESPSAFFDSAPFEVLHLVFCRIILQDRARQHDSLIQKGVRHL